MSGTIRAALCLVLVSVFTARADIMPPSLAGVDADGTFSLPTTNAAGRTYQYTIDSSQMTGLIGQAIVGMQWRLNGSATTAWPAAAASYASWDVYVGPGVDPSAMSNTFASNFTGAPTQVRSGPFSVTASSFPSGSSPNAFGQMLDFTTPYVYTGGDLTVEMRFAMQTGTTIIPSLDAVLASGGPGNGWGVNFAGRWATGSTATTAGANGNLLVTNFVVPEPASSAAVGILLAGALRRKPRQR